MLGAGNAEVNRVVTDLPSRSSRLMGEMDKACRSPDFRGPLPGRPSLGSYKLAKCPSVGKSWTLLAGRDLNYSLRADAGFQINLHKIGPILLEQQINSSFYRLSNHTYSPLNLTTNSADDQAFSLVPLSTHVLPFPSS